MSLDDVPFEDLFFEEYFGHQWAVNGGSRTITWTVSDDVVNFPGLGTVGVDAAIGGSMLRDLRKAFDYWDDALDTISFSYRSTSSTTDITLGLVGIDGPSNILGIWDSVTSGSTITRAAILFDTDDSPLSPFGYDGSFFTVAVHEIGNVLGLGDIAASRSIQSVMEDPLAELLPQSGGLWEDDVALIKRYYGEIADADPSDDDPSDTGTDGGSSGPGGLPTIDLDWGTTGPPSDGLIAGTEGDDVLDGTPGDDTFVFSAGSDRIAGGTGEDTLVISGDIDAYTLRFSSVAEGDTQAILFHREAYPEGAQITGIERLVFDTGNGIFTDGVVDLTNFDGIRTLDDAALMPLAEMYIAYFDRAPDAVGLSYWATRLADGMSMEEIAESFFAQPETQTRYPADMDNATLVQTAYNNFLGRDPDPAGWEYWTQELDAGLSRGTFMLSVINGARDNSSAEALLDTQTIQQKTDIGLHFAGYHGLSDTDAAREAMAIFERDNTSSILEAEAFIGGYASDAHDSGPDAEFRLDMRDLLPVSVWDIA